VGRRKREGHRKPSLSSAFNRRFAIPENRRSATDVWPRVERRRFAVPGLSVLGVPRPTTPAPRPRFPIVPDRGCRAARGDAGSLSPVRAWRQHGTGGARRQRRAAGTGGSGGFGDDAVAAVLLGLVESLVGAMDQGLRGFAVRFDLGDADADRHLQRHLVLADQERRGAHRLA